MQALQGLTPGKRLGKRPRDDESLAEDTADNTAFNGGSGQHKGKKKKVVINPMAGVKFPGVPDRDSALENIPILSKTGSIYAPFEPSGGDCGWASAVAAFIQLPLQYPQSFSQIGPTTPAEARAYFVHFALSQQSVLRNPDNEEYSNDDFAPFFIIDNHPDNQDPGDFPYEIARDHQESEVSRRRRMCQFILLSEASEPRSTQLYWLSLEGLHLLLKNVMNLMWRSTPGSTREQWFDSSGPAFASIGPVAVSTTYVDTTFRTVHNQVLTRRTSSQHADRYAIFCNLNPGGNHFQTFVSMKGPTVPPFQYVRDPIPRDVFNTFFSGRVPRRSLVHDPTIRSCRPIRRIHRSFPILHTKNRRPTRHR